MIRKTVTLAGNPNVGKSTLFNYLTGMNQHTGNWPGKTVTNMKGSCRRGDICYELVDVPGSYSLTAQSAEEEAARDHICFGHSHSVLVVCDATCLRRNLNLLLQIMETGVPTVLCVNLMDEAESRGITVDTEKLESLLHIPVVGISARKKQGIEMIFPALDRAAAASPPVVYPESVEKAAVHMRQALEGIPLEGLDPGWLSLKLLEQDAGLCRALGEYLGYDLPEHPAVKQALADTALSPKDVREAAAASLYKAAENLCRDAVTNEASTPGKGRLLADRIITGKITGIPCAVLLLALVFFITVKGASYPSAFLSRILLGFQPVLAGWLQAAGSPPWLMGLTADGIYRVMAWVVAVMLPPMAIFFPLFTFLEDLGYLPRLAFNLDERFRRCAACGKQALTMCMGFGCNAVGVTGCRIIDSPRERLMAVVTNSFVPCNGRFPLLVLLIGLFFGKSDLSSALFLTAFILLGVGMTLAVSKILSLTLLKGYPSSFTLELPPYRKPDLLPLIRRTVLDRIIFVLGRAVCAAAPAGAVIWLLGNLEIGGISLLTHLASLLDPVGRIMGLDGVILLAFILGIPANEIVLPIAVMIYLSCGMLLPAEDAAFLGSVFTANGWTSLTALNMMLFSLFHWPCATTLMTVKKETGRISVTVLAAVLPTLTGVLLCLLTTGIFHLFS